MNNKDLFKKIQISVSLKKVLPDIDKLNCIEVGYPDSNGNIVWKNSGRTRTEMSAAFIKNKSRSGKEIDAILPSGWNEFGVDRKEFVFDFVKNATPGNILIKVNIFFEDNETPELHQFELPESKSKLSLKYLDIRTKRKDIGMN